MIVQSIVHMCCKPDRCADNTAKALDWITAVALLVIGVLGAVGVFHLQPAAAYAFIGAGVVYTLTALLRALIDAGFHSRDRHVTSF